jgi:hypothetical protein
MVDESHHQHARRGFRHLKRSSRETGFSVTCAAGRPRPEEVTENETFQAFVDSTRIITSSLKVARRDQ